MRHTSLLNAENVVSIFMWKFTYAYRTKATRVAKSKQLATAMRVSLKTIRDIWNGKSWGQVTSQVRDDTRWKQTDAAGIEIDATIYHWELFSASRPVLDDPFAEDAPTQ